MKRITIFYDEGITDIVALSRALEAFKYDDERTGVITFTDGSALAYSDTSKHPSVTIWKQKQ